MRKRELCKELIQASMDKILACKIPYERHWLICVCLGNINMALILGYITNVEYDAYLQILDSLT